MYSLLVDCKYLEARDTLSPRPLFFYLLSLRNMTKIVKGRVKLHLIYSC